MICHELDIFRTAKVGPTSGDSKFELEKLEKRFQTTLKNQINGKIGQNRSNP